MTIKKCPMMLRAVLAVFVSIFTGIAALRAADPVAFPGAEGYGAVATGGRGGSVYIVTNLNDSGPGSFRDAVSASNRTVVFAVGGVININSAITVQPNITIAGQTAPGDGITIYGNTVAFRNNVICRYIRLHGSINMPSANYTLSAGGMVKGIFDHVSVAWGRWDNMKLDSASTDITFQYCLVGEAIQPQRLGALFEGPKKITVHHTFWANNHSRNPKAKADIEYINNVVYNWGGAGFVGGHSSATFYQDLINNYFIAGPNSSTGGFVTDFGSTDHVYHSGNLVDLDKNGSLAGTREVTNNDFTRAGATLESQRHNISSVTVTIDDAATALQKVIAKAGASDRRDPVDARMITQLQSYGTQGALTDREGDVGGQPSMAGGISPKDSNNDGIPDWWADAMETSPTDNTFANTVRADGYTNLEFYINSIVTSGVPEAVITGITPASGTAVADPLTGGSITAAQTFSIKGTAAAGATVEVSRVDTGPLGTAVADSSGNWTYDYTTTLSARYYAFTACVKRADNTLTLPSAAYAVHVKTSAIAPAISWLVLTPGQEFSGTAEPYSTVNVYDTTGGAPGSVVATGTADGYGNWTADTAASFPPAQYSFEAVATDLAGNTSVNSSTYIIDTNILSPVFTGITDDTGASSTDRITSDQTLTINGTAPANANIKVYLAGNAISAGLTANAGGDWSFDYTATTLPEGTHTFMATADAGGTPSAMSAPFVVKIDRTAPTVANIRRHDPDTTSTSAATLVFRVTFVEPVAGVAQNNFTVTRNGSGMTGNITGFAQIDDSTYDVTVTGAAGDGTIRVNLASNLGNIKDLAGNAATVSYTSGQTYTMRYQGSGVWNTDANAEWSETSAWEDGAVASGIGATADFSTVDIADQVTVTLDSPRTLGRLVFADADVESPGTWLVTSGTFAASITLANPNGAMPELSAIYGEDTTGAKGGQAELGAAVPVTIDSQVSSAAGLLKTGWGTAILNNIGTFSGSIVINQGRLYLGEGALLNTTSPLNVADPANKGACQFVIMGGTFSTTANSSIYYATANLIEIVRGRADFRNISTSGEGGGLIRIRGGIFNAGDVNIGRTSASTGDYSHGFIVSGGTATVANLGIATANSYACLSVEGGKLDVTGTLTLGWQVTSGRGGQARVRDGGEVVANTILLSRTSGNTATFDITNGTVTATRLALGYDGTNTAGSATFTINGANSAFYLGANGIVKNGTLTSTINLTQGTLGADDDWSTTVPMVVSNGGSIIIKAANAANAARDITLGGALSGAGAITKTGGGTLNLSAVNTHTGPITVSAGVLNVTGRIATAPATVTINAGGFLTGSGTINRPVVLNGGALIIGGEPLVLGSLTKQGAGTVPIVLADTSLAASSRIPIATFESTNLTSSDFELFVQDGKVFMANVTGTSLDLVAYSFDSDNEGTGVTGGGSAQPVVVTTAAELKTALEAAAPANVVISGQIDLSSAGGVINVASDKAIIGRNGDSTILGAVTLSESTSNVVILGVNITNPAGNGLVLDGAKNVYVTHCTFLDCDGALVSVINGAENVTISWSEFYYSQTFTGTQRSAMRIGRPGAETKPFAITLHHNYWDEGCAGDMPAANYGQIHMYDNYLRAPGSTTATIVGAHSQMLSSHNVYQNMTAAITKDPGGLLVVVDNTYVSTPDTLAAEDTKDKVFVPAYSYVLDPATVIGVNIPGYAGNTGGAGSATPATAAGSVSVLNPGVPVPNGGTLMLAAAVHGVTPASYQWHLDNFPIPGATESVYTVTEAKAVTHAGTYTVSVGLSTGETIVSAGSKVEIGANNLPLIVNISVDQNVRTGDRAVFAVIVSSDTPVSYQWQKNGVIIPFANSPAYYVNTATRNDIGTYKVVVTNDAGTVTSPEVKLTLSDTDTGGGDGGGGAPSWWLLGAGALFLLLRGARKWKRHLAAFGLAFLTAAAFAPTSTRAADGTWGAAGNGNWSDSTNWAGGTVADGAGSTANFTNAGNKTVTVNAPVTIGNLTFGGGNWTIATSGASNTLTLEMGTFDESTAPITNPVINVGDTTDTISVSLGGTQGFTKTGTGILILSGSNSITGHVLISATSGILRVGTGGYLNLGSGNLRVTGGTTSIFEVAGGTFITTGRIIAGTQGTSADLLPLGASGVSTNMSRMVMSGGYANIGEFRTASDSNAALIVTGGTLVANQINILRNAASSGSYAGGLIVQGGIVEANHVGISVGNSNGAMSVEGGTITVSGSFLVANGATSTRGGQLRVIGGRLTSTDIVDGLILCKTNGTNANTPGVFLVSGGVATLEKITLGYDATMNAGSATVTLSGGALYLGTGGIVKNGAASGFTTTITLSGGTLGAKGDWSTAHPIAISGNTTILAASESSVANDITFNGVVSGAGAITKAGAGVLTLSAANTFTGEIAVNAGKLEVTGAIATSANEVVINSGGFVSGTGTINRTVVLNGGGLDVNDTAPLAVTTLNKNGSGIVPVNYTGAAPGDGAITLVTFDSTSLTDADFQPFVLPSGDQVVVKVSSGKLELITKYYTAPGVPPGITGGEGGQTVSVTTPADLKAALEATGPALVIVSGVLDLAGIGGVINIAPDKTIAGENDTVTISGQLNVPASSGNVVIVGLNITNTAGKGLVIDGAQDVYITHCSFFDCNGPLVSAINGADNITVSWSEFYYTAGFAGQRAAMQIGNPGAEPTPLNIVLHHNHWHEGCTVDMPVADHGHVHMYDNYLRAPGNTSATIVGAQSQMLSEHNVYQDITAPLAKTGGLLFTLDNTCVDTTGSAATGEDIVFVPDYPRVLETAEAVGTLVPLYAGNHAGMNSLPPSEMGKAVILSTGTQVPAGGAFTLIASAPGLEVASYQWNLNNLPIAGATGPGYVVGDAKPDIDTGPYSVAVKLPTGETLMSGAARVTVGDGAPPVIKVQPAPIVIARGSTAVFTVVAEGSAVLKYQWQKNGAPMGGENRPTLYLLGAQDRDLASYSVVVSNEYGSATSDAATLEFRDAGSGGGGGGGAPSWLFLSAIAVLASLRAFAARRS